VAVGGVTASGQTEMDGRTEASLPAWRAEAVSFLTFNALFWLACYVLLTVYRSVFMNSIEADSLIWRFLTILAVFAMTTGLHAVFVWRGLKGVALIAWAAGLSPFMGAAHVLINTLVFNVIADFPIWPPFEMHFFELYSGMVWTQVAWAAAYIAWASVQEARRETARALAAESLARDAQLHMLHYQINPHFLFNALNAISALILDGRNADAEVMLTRLAAFLRYALEQDPTVKVRLKDELAAQAQYLGVEQARFPDKLRIEVRTGHVVDEALAPSMILQPIIENAIKYAVAPSRRPTAVRVSADADGDRLVLQVEDDGPQGALDKSRYGAGMGLANVRQRLAVLYGGRAELQAGPRADGGFCARLILPLEYAA
jgi:two-component system, LytTR family, sensor kinase